MSEACYKVIRIYDDGCTTCVGYVRTQNDAKVAVEKLKQYASASPMIYLPSTFDYKEVENVKGIQFYESGWDLAVCYDDEMTEMQQ